MKNLFFSFLKEFLFALGVCWLLLKLTDFFFHDRFIWLNSITMFWRVLLVSAIYSIIINWPWKKIRYRIGGIDTFISIQYGDILKINNNLVISTNNFFTTDPSLISSKSLLGQFISKYYAGDSSIITHKVQDALHSLPPGQTINVNIRNNISYPIGSVISFVGVENKHIFLMATTNIHYDKGNAIIHSEPSFLLKALDNLWKKVETTIDDQVLTMPPVGSGISHSFKRTSDAIFFIAQSFANRAKEKRPCSELKIYVRKNDLNFYEYQELRDGIRFLVK